MFYFSRVNDFGSISAGLTNVILFLQVNECGYFCRVNECGSISAGLTWAAGLPRREFC